MNNKEKVIEIAHNRKAYHDYEIIFTIEAGIVLVGTEIKSIREHNVNLKDSFVTIKGNKVILHNMHISPYHHGNRYNHDPLRPRILLLNKKEILKLSNYESQKGFTIVPLRLYIKNNWAKLEIAVVKGKKTYNKKEVLKYKDLEREAERELKNYNY